MKNRLLYWLIGIWAILLIVIVGGYGYSCISQSKMAEIWKQALQEDCENRMREVNAIKIHKFSSDTLSDVKIKTERQTLQIRKKGSESLNTEEKNFIADQSYLSIKNPVIIEKLDSLFRMRLEENGFLFETAVLFRNETTGQNSLYSRANEESLHSYLRLPCKINFQGTLFLVGYVKGSWLENWLWGSVYYIVLSLLFVVLGGVLSLVLWKRRKTNVLDKLIEQKDVKSIDKDTQPTSTLNEQSIGHVITLDEKKNVVVFDDKEIQLTPKVFGLFYQLSQGKGYFQSYEFLLKKLWVEEENTDKKNLEQLVNRLRKDLKDISCLNIDTVRGSGYQITAENDLKIVLNVP